MKYALKLIFKTLFLYYTVYCVFRSHLLVLFPFYLFLSCFLLEYNIYRHKASYLWICLYVSSLHLIQTSYLKLNQSHE